VVTFPLSWFEDLAIHLIHDGFHLMEVAKFAGG
jgi:hypothetical protein